METVLRSPHWPIVIRKVPHEFHAPKIEEFVEVEILRRAVVHHIGVASLRSSCLLRAPRGRAAGLATNEARALRHGHAAFGAVLGRVID